MQTSSKHKVLTAHQQLVDIFCVHASETQKQYQTLSYLWNIHLNRYGYEMDVEDLNGRL